MGAANDYVANKVNISKVMQDTLFYSQHSRVQFT